jgi:hypothetical protein
MTAAADINGARYLRGVKGDHKEFWSSMKFLHKDISINDVVNEQSFLKILPGQLEQHLEEAANIMGQNLLVGKAVEKLAANGTVGGIATVVNPERYQLHQKVQFLSTVVVAPITGFIKTIDVNSGQLFIVTTYDGAIAVDLSTLLVADAAKIYLDSQATDGFTSVLDYLLPASAGGLASIYGIAKGNLKQLQAIAQDGSAFVAADLAKNIFKHYVKTRKVGSGKPDQLLMSYNNYAALVNQIEQDKKAYNVIAMNPKMEQFAWDSITIGGMMAGGKPVTAVALQEMNDSEIIAFDKSTWKMCSNGGYQKHKDANGNEFYTVRGNGYEYIVDSFIFGDLCGTSFDKNGVIYGLNITY